MTMLPDGVALVKFLYCDLFSLYLTFLKLSFIALSGSGLGKLDLIEM